MRKNVALFGSFGYELDPTLPNSQLGQNLAKPGWNCHHDNFKDSNPNIEWKATLEQAEKVGMGTRAYTLKKV